MRSSPGSGARWRRVPALVLLPGIIVTVYLLVYRPRALYWGATDREVWLALPGDDVQSRPTFNATRAITISVPAHAVWPWLVQMGFQRAGFYGYDLIENIGSKRGIRSADRIIPELQQLEVGDTVPISAVARLAVHSLDPERALVWVGFEKPPNGTLAWILTPIDAQHTRLISRVRFRHRWWPPQVMFLDMLTEFTDHIAVRKILLGIRDRAEGHPEPMLEQIGEMALWLVAAVQFVIALILLFRRSRWLPAWVLALLSALVLQLALYAPTLWAVVVLMEGIILFGLIRTSRRTSPPLSETPQRMHQASG